MKFIENPNTSIYVNDVNRELFGPNSTLTRKQKNSVFLEDVCPDPKRRGRKKGTKVRKKVKKEITTTVNIFIMFPYNTNKIYS